MKKNQLKVSSLALVLASVMSLASCTSDSEMALLTSTKTFKLENVVTPKMYVESGSFVGVGSEQVKLPVVLPGQSISIKFKAARGQAFMFATMYGVSKDWFFASQQPGITLFDDNGQAKTGDVSSQVKLWDNGTKNDTTGAAESNPIAEVAGVTASQLMRLTLAFEDTTSEFTLTIENTSANTGHETPFSPGVWAVSNFDGKELLAKQPFFIPGQLSNPEITAIAEGGKIDMLKEKVEAETGLITGLSPVLVVVYQGNKNPIFEEGQKSSEGLKDLAQKGDTQKLVAALKAMPNVRDVKVLGNVPIAPSQSVEGQFTFSNSDHIAFATMYGFSNDWFYAGSFMIGANSTGNITGTAKLYDSGTGVDQFPGAGNHQAVFKGTPQPEDKAIQEVNTMYPVPAVEKVLRLTIK